MTLWSIPRLKRSMMYILTKFYDKYKSMVSMPNSRSFVSWDLKFLATNSLRITRRWLCLSCYLSKKQPFAWTLLASFHHNIRKNWGRYLRYKPIWKKTLFEIKTSTTLESFESLKNASTFGPILIHVPTKRFIQEGNVSDLAVGSFSCHNPMSMCNYIQLRSVHTNL